MSPTRYEAPLPFEYRIIRSQRRRTAAIQIKGDAVEVRVPHWVEEAWIEGFVRERRDWVASRLASVRAQRELHRIDVVQGAAIPFRGRSLRLEWQRGEVTRLEPEGDRLRLTLSRRVRRCEHRVAEETLRSWLLQQAGEVLPARLQALAARTGLAPSGVSVRSFRRRWGSCDNRGGIALNWRLILADPRVADYVLIHELCHLRHFDHSPAFWRLVQRHCPDHRHWQAYLRERGCWLEW